MRRSPGRTGRPRTALRREIAMPMPQRVQYSAEIEPLVQFIEETAPADILDRTLEKLRARVPIPTMQTAPAIQVFDLLMSVAIQKNWNDDHYFMFPGAMWRAFETGILDKKYLPLLMRPVVRYVTRSPVLPLNPVPNPMPAIEALIEEHGLLTRILRHRSGEDGTAAIAELGEAIGRVDVYS